MANKPEKEKKHFFKNFKAELKKVIWPTPKQIVNNTVAVVTVVLVTTVIVLVLDLAFEGLNTFGINKLKAVISSNQNVENSIQSDDNINEESNVTETNNTEVENTNNENLVTEQE